MITDYCYDPVTSLLEKITDPRCETLTYHYDDFNRLEFIKDMDGNIIEQYEYNYRDETD